MKKIGKLQEYSGETSRVTDGYYTSRLIPRKINELIDTINDHECCINAHTEWINAALNESQETKASEEKCGCDKMGPCNRHYRAKPQEEPKKCCEKCRQYLSKNMNRYECNRYFACPCHQKETEPKEETDAEWEERQARELAESFNVMPKDMAEHQRNVYNAVRDAIYLCRNRFIKSQE